MSIKQQINQDINKKKLSIYIGIFFFIFLLSGGAYLWKQQQMKKKIQLFQLDSAYDKDRMKYVDFKNTQKANFIKNLELIKEVTETQINKFSFKNCLKGIDIDFSGPMAPYICDNNKNKKIRNILISNKNIPIIKIERRSSRLFKDEKSSDILFQIYDQSDKKFKIFIILDSFEIAISKSGEYFNDNIFYTTDIKDINVKNKIIDFNISEDIINDAIKNKLDENFNDNLTPINKNI